MVQPCFHRYFLTTVLAGVAAFSLAVSASATEVKVYSNNPEPGDSFTNPGTANNGQAVGGSGWYYNNVRNNGVVGINDTFARSGNGSAYFEAVQGPGGASSKADIEFFNSAALFNGNYVPTSSLGKLNDLTHFSYDWYRSSTSTAGAHLHPVLRLYVANDALTQVGYLVFEREYNGFASPAPVDTWVTDDIFAGNYRLWSTGSLPLINQYYIEDIRLQNWIANYGHYNVIGISAGVGSGWGYFEGAVDNITVGFNGASTTYNFEVIPEPAFFQMGALAAMSGFGLLRLRRKA